MSSSLTSVRRRPVVIAGVLVLVAAFGFLLAFQATRPAGAIPVLSPVYDIETESNGYRASLLGLQLGQPGVVLAPRPVDVDGDLVSDVLVSVNLIDLAGVVQNPPTPGQILAPNIEITRDPVAVALGRPSPPLKIQVKLTVKDSENLRTDTVVRFGYDTGRNGALPLHGSVPQTFKAVVRGLDTFFNPITAEVTTVGLTPVGLPMNGYDGPLDIVASIGTAKGLTDLSGVNLTDVLGTIDRLVNPPGEIATGMRFGYRPFPGTVRVSFGTDDAGNHVVYEHDTRAEVDLDTHIVNFGRNADVLDRSTFTARVDRLPRRVTLDFDTSGAAGNLRYRDGADGRLPDVSLTAAIERLRVDQTPGPPTQRQIDVSTSLAADLVLVGARFDASVGLVLGSQPTTVTVTTPIAAPLFADVDVDALPPDFSADWSFAPGSPASGRFDAGGQGIGAVQADIRNYYGAPVKLANFVPEEQQYLSFQTALGGEFGEENAIKARLEKIRHTLFCESVAQATSVCPASATGGFTATVRVGDGELPLLANFESDDRAGAGGRKIMARATVAPLPDDITLALRGPGTDEKVAPLTARYESSKSVDVTARLEVHEAGAGPACGRARTTCADLALRHVPATIEARIGSFAASSDLGPPSELFAESRIEVDLIPRAGGAQPDLFADVVIGLDDDIPLVAHAELLGMPRFNRIRLKEGRDETLDRAEFHACDFRYEQSPPACTPTTANDRIGSVSAVVRNWLDRPEGLPILLPDTPLYATVAARGEPGTTDVRFEATAKVTDVAELQYRNTGKVFGLRSRVGATQPLSALLDLGNIEFAGDNAANGRVNVAGEARITPLPGEFDLCFRQADQTIEVLADDFTDPCEDANPFGDAANLTRSPISIAYRANTAFDVSTNLVVTQLGPSPAVADDHTYRARLGVDDLPRNLTAHIQAPPKGVEGPIRAKSTADAQANVNVFFAGESTDGDLICSDPRTPALGAKALCAKGTIENLPTNFSFLYDPTKVVDNLSVDTTTSVNLTGLELALVEGVRKSTNPASPGFATIIPNVLIAEADVIGLPKTVRGTIDLPGTVELTASPPLGEVNLKSARNFVVPDPTPAAEPSREVRPGLTVTPSDANLQKLVFFGRQDTDTDRLLFRGYGRVKAVAGFGFKTQRDAARNLLDTRVITVDFGRDSTVRVYADVDLGTAHLLGDVTIPDVPAGMTLCFRGAKDDAASAEPVAPVFCDRAPADDQGAFQFVARPKDPSKRLDVHAFVRLSTGAGADVLAGRVDILNVPRVVQGTFGGEATEVAGFDALDADGSGTGPDGIDRIGFHLASFDIADHGYSARPYAERRVERDPFPAVATARQHVGLAADDTDFELVGRIGEVEPSAVAGSDLRRILIANRACAKPAGFGSRPDFPFYPNEVDAGGNPVWSYTCVRGDFEEVGPDAPDPLDLHAVIDRGGERIAVRQAGLTEIPSFFQLNLAEGPSLVPGTDPNRALRPPCGSSSLANCAPPFIRFDTPGESVLAGVAEFGRISDLALVGDPGLDPRSGDTADLDAAPGLDGCGWGDWAACAPGNSTAGAKGIRAKVGRFGEPSGESRTAVRAGLRLLVPPSLTVDQIQSWSVASLAPYVSASDLRFHYIVRDVNGSVVPSLGELTALVHSFADGDQIVITDSRNPARGFPIPGEIGLGLFVRDHKQNGRMMLQVDGRLSVQENIRARIFSPTATNLDANILSVPALTTGSWPQDPSFRLRAEVLSEGDSPPPPGSGSSGGGGTGDPPKEDSCSVLYCLETQVRLKEVHALFDFAPSGTPARLLEAVVNTGGTKNGVQVKGWSTVNGGAAAPITARADVLVSPINVFLHAGIPIIGSFDFILLSDLAAGIRIENSSDFQLRQNLLHVTGESNGFSVPTSVSALVPCAGVSCLFVDYRIYQLHGIAFSLIGLLWGNPVLLGVDYLPPSLPRPPIDSFADPTGLTGAVPVEFRDCRTFGQVGTTNILPITPGIGANAVVFPDLDRLIFYGTLAPIFEGVKFIADLVAPVFCFFPADAEEIPLVGPSGTSPGDANRNPGNPLSMFSQHPVPGIAAASDGAAPVSGPVAPQPLTVSGTLALCGDRIFDRVTVPSGATLQVAGAADASDLVIGGVNLGDRCPAGSEGRLAITAVRAVTVGNGGKVAGAGGTLSLIGETVTVAAGGSVTGSTGRVVLASANDLTVAGSVRADGVSSSPPAGGTSATGNSGGGHGGKGGDGSDGTGGGAYGDTTFVPDDDDGLVVVERGAPGSSVTAGKGAGRGGGALSLLAGQRVLISGPVTADGVEGVVRTSSECASGEKGVGGGSGGAILLAAPSVQIQGGGSVRAVGGFGRTGPGGGGGGGAGGRVKVKSPLFTGTPSLGGGSAGGALGCMGAAVGSPGAGGQLVRDPTPTSNVLPFLDFWQRGSPLPVTFSAAAGLAGDPADPSDDFQVVLCGFPVRADRPDRDLTPADNKADGLQQSFPPMAGTLQPPSAAAPCGSYAFPDSFFNADPVLLGSRSFTNATTAFGQTISANMPLPPDVRGNGFWGVWTNVLKPGTDTNNCLDHTDIGGFLGLFYDLIDCSVEPNPGTPETVFGFDNTPPNFDVEAAGLALSNADGVKVSLSSRITLSIAPPQGATTPDFDIMAGDVSTVGLSGLKLFRCSNDGATFVPCQAGAQQWDLAGGTGSRTVTVQAFDLAGNVTTKMVTVVVDTLAPTSAGQIRAALPPGVELKNNGWYTASPQFRLFGFADPDQADGTKGSGFGGYAYRFDEGMERTNCDPASPAGECLITDPLELPGPGRHTLYWQAVDQLGNRQTLQSLPVRIDGESPLVAFSTVPAAPDGANGWFTGPTFGAVSAFDRPAGGSGLKVKAGDPPADPGTVFGAFYGIDGPANIPVGGAFPIPAGTHFVCYRAMDVAGNTAGQACTASIRVDLAPPDVAIVPSPAVPDGANGWYVSEPTVRILGTDPVPGSGISLATAPSGVFASVDGLAYTAVTGPRTIPEGRHIVRAFSVDVSGQRSPVREMTFKVDLSHPVTTARALPPDPAAGQWWRRVPRVVLRATDGQANAGVGAIEYRIDGGPPQTYTGPFAVPSGAHTVTYRALDLSGPANTEPDRVVGVPVDVTPPLVKATEASPAIWLRLLGLFGPAQARLNWQLSDDLSGTVRVRVVVHNVAGQVVRRIDDGTRTVTPATTLSGFTLWDGRDDSLLGIVPAGVYYYRVTVIDEAGNTAHSGESKPLQIKVL